ncbi:MAG: FcoT family thioesterase [Planctomycetota bacterium]
MNEFGAAVSRVIPVEPSLLKAVLQPYKTHCRYLKNAEVEAFTILPDAANTTTSGQQPLVRAKGNFEIPESWYIDETGHFNSIEFNLCYNQLVYVLIGQCIVSKLIPELARMTYEEYRRRQLPDVLIVKFSSTFRKAMDSKQFKGNVYIDRVSDRGKMLLLKTRCDFFDESGGCSDGEVTLAIVNDSHRSSLASAL